MSQELARSLIGRVVTEVSFSDDPSDRSLMITFDNGSYVQLAYASDRNGYEALEASVWLGPESFRADRLFFERVVDDPNPEDRR